MGFTVETDERLAVVDVTDRVAAAVPDVERGVCTAFVEHTTDGLVVNEAESRLLGPSAAVPVRDGDLALGMWQSVLLVEADGPRTRRVS